MPSPRAVAAAAISVCAYVLLFPIELVASLILVYKTRAHHPSLKTTALSVAYIRAELARGLLREDPVTEKLLTSLPWAPGAVSWLCAAYLILPIWKHLEELIPYILRVPTVMNRVRDLVYSRTRFIDQRLAAARGKQLVILGAGFDSRCYVSRYRAGRRCFEVDLASTQRAKREALVAAKVDTKHVQFVEVDFRNESWLSKLEEHGFDTSEPAIIIWEGVTPYLDREAVSATLGLVAQCAPGTELVLDYVSAATARGEVAPHMARIVQAMGEPFLCGFEDCQDVDGPIGSFAREHNMQVKAWAPFGVSGWVTGGVAALRAASLSTSD